LTAAAGAEGALVVVAGAAVAGADVAGAVVTGAVVVGLAGVVGVAGVEQDDNSNDPITRRTVRIAKYFFIVPPLYIVYFMLKGKSLIQINAL
jgi:hypothetical protein